MLRAAIAAWLLVLVVVAPAGAVEGPTRLLKGVVSPGTGTPTTTITFAVEYRNREGSAPAYVRVVIDGKAHDMAGDGGDDWKQGVGHHYTAKLPAGTHDVLFVAADTRKFSDEVPAGTVTITVPPPPTPKPDPTPHPEPNTTPDPTPAPAPGGHSAGSGSGGTGSAGTGQVGGGDGGPIDNSGLPGADVGGTATSVTDGQTWGSVPDDRRSVAETSNSPIADGTSEDAPSALAGVVASPWLSAGGSGPTSTAGGSTSGPGSSGAVRTGGRGGLAGAGSWGGLGSALDDLGLSGPSAMPLLPTVVGSTGAVAMAMAFAIFGKKRRDEEQPAPDEVLQANAARGTGVIPTATMIAAAPPTPIDLEASMPRWRRPSLQQARKADPTRSVTVAPRLRFNDSHGAGIGYERRTIRYRVVGLLDAPDELRSVEIGQLDQGDEVQLLEKSGAYWLVVCPDGRRGWLHKMTLGDAVVDETASSADAWSVGDIDGDVLSAYLAARARA
ncbi:MAG: hypothetical protein ACJ77F_02925 [Chloroflexota bacterium]